MCRSKLNTPIILVVFMVQILIEYYYSVINKNSIGTWPSGNMSISDDYVRNKQFDIIYTGS